MLNPSRSVQASGCCQYKVLRLSNGWTLGLRQGNTWKALSDHPNQEEAAQSAKFLNDCTNATPQSFLSHDGTPQIMVPFSIVELYMLILALQDYPAFTTTRKARVSWLVEHFKQHLATQASSAIPEWLESLD